MSGDAIALVKIRAAKIYVRRKDLASLKAIHSPVTVIAEMTPSSDHLTAFIGLPSFPIFVERGLAVMAGKTLSIGTDFSWCDRTGKRLYEFEDGVLVGKRT